MAGEARWFIVHTYSGYEDKVESNIRTVVKNRGIEDQIQQVIVPKEEVTEVKDDGSTKIVIRKKYPSYVFIRAAVHEKEDSDQTEWVMDDQIWYIIRNTRGVTGFVGPESKATPVPDYEVKKYGIETKSIEVNYDVGDDVTITAGAFEGMNGPVESIDKKAGTLVVKVSMFGKETPVTLALTEVANSANI